MLDCPRGRTRSDRTAAAVRTHYGHDSEERTMCPGLGLQQMWEISNDNAESEAGGASPRELICSHRL